MKKGWNYEYFVYKKNQLEERLKKTNDLNKREILEKEIELCTYLMTILLFSTGETFYDKSTTMKSFVEEMYGQDFLYEISSSELNKIEQITLSLSKLPKLNIEQCNTHIKTEDAIEIVGDFIKDKFGNRHYQLYRNTLMGENVLFDKGTELSDVTYLDGEIFLRIAETEDIKMLSSIAHESGHIYRILNNDNKILENFYREYESFFYEFNLLLWLIKNNIYSKEATNYFLYLFDILEKILIMRNFINKYQLNRINNPNMYKETINKLHLKKELHVRKAQDFFDIYSTTINIDLLTYFNSFIATINNIDDFDTYEQVIRNIKPGNENDIRVKILRKNECEYNSYLKYRNFLQSCK